MPELSLLWKAFGPNMDTLITILAVPVILFAVVWGFGSDIKAGWNWVRAKAKGKLPASIAVQSETPFETLLDAVDQLAHDQSLTHDKRFEFAAEALNLAKRVSDDEPIVLGPTEIVPHA